MFIRTLTKINPTALTTKATFRPPTFNPQTKFQPTSCHSLMPFRPYSNVMKTPSSIKGVLKSAIQTDKLPQVPSDWTSDNLKTFLNRFATSYGLVETEKEKLINSLKGLTGEDIFKFDEESLNKIIRNEKVAKDLYKEMGGSLTVGEMTNQVLGTSMTWLSPLILVVIVGLFFYYKKETAEKEAHYAKSQTKKE